MYQPDDYGDLPLPIRTLFTEEQLRAHEPTIQASLVHGLLGIGMNDDWRERAAEIEEELAGASTNDQSQYWAKLFYEARDRGRDWLAAPVERSRIKE